MTVPILRVFGSKPAKNAVFQLVAPSFRRTGHSLSLPPGASAGPCAARLCLPANPPSRQKRPDVDRGALVFRQARVFERPPLNL
jgi:hypothetical protein